MEEYSRDVEEKIKKEFEAANEDRDYSIYVKSIDAALEAKAKSIFPHFNVEEGDVIVDAGSGTGVLTELAAREFRGAKVYALDISHELLERADEERALTHLVYGDARKQNFPSNSIKVKYYSTSGHEIESFGGEGSMQGAVKNTFRELVPGGRIIIRDFAKPTRTEPVYMKILSNVGLKSLPRGLKDEEINYNLLSTSLLLERFQKEFGEGDDFSYDEVEIEGEKYIKIDLEWAHEFYLRKDYTGNWRQEIKEKYTYWTLEEARQILENEGYINVGVSPDPNEYIVKNRLDGKIKLYEMKDGKLQGIPFPPTHMVVVGEKPINGKVVQWVKSHILSQAVDYKELLASIKIDEKNNKVCIGNRCFMVESTKPMLGTKKRVFRLRDKPSQILRVAREDPEDHSREFLNKEYYIQLKYVLA